MVSDNQAKILDRIAKEYQVSLTLTRRLHSRFSTEGRRIRDRKLGEHSHWAGTLLFQQRILDLKEKWNKEIAYPEDMETG